MQYGCEVWGRHSPGVAAANMLGRRCNVDVITALGRSVTCGRSTSCKMSLAELGLLLQVFWWRHTLQFWSGLAALAEGSLYHTACFDNLTAFRGGVLGNMATSLAACLRSVGLNTPRVCDVVPLLDVNCVVEAVPASLKAVGGGASLVP